jgi:hypothetical protein
MLPQPATAHAALPTQPIAAKLPQACSTSPCADEDFGKGTLDGLAPRCATPSLSSLVGGLRLERHGRGEYPAEVLERARRAALILAALRDGTEVMHRCGVVLVVLAVSTMLWSGQYVPST